jgi:hypothetical protein
MADITTTRVFVDGERGITAAKLNDIVGSSAIQPAFYTSKPTASTLVAGDKMLALKSGAYVQSDFQNVIDSVSAAISSDAEIWNVRLRSFNAIGNPNFEVDQRNAGAILGNPATGFIQDRWSVGRAGTMAFNVGRNVGDSSIVVPGTNFRISGNWLGIRLTTQQASLGTGDFFHFYQQVEGNQLRELIGDVHSVSLLVQSSVAGLKFAFYLRDNPPTKTLVKLCTIPTANVWTLIPLANLPVWPAGNFSILPGTAGYYFGICLAAGANSVAPAADTWQNGSFLGAPGMSNFAANAVNSTFLVGFVQHEPGPVCSTFQDKTFQQNYDESLRHFQKTYNYAVVPGTVTPIGLRAMIALSATTNSYGPVSFLKPMAKVPTMTAYNYATGAANSVRDGGAVDHTGAVFANLGETGFPLLQFTTATTAAMNVYLHYTADTGW